MTGTPIYSDPIQWVRDNWQQILCDTSEVGLYFKMFRLIKNATKTTPQGMAWFVAEEMAWAALRLAACPTDRDEIPEYPGDPPAGCQCADPYGNLNLTLQSLDGSVPIKVVSFINPPEVVQILETYRLRANEYYCRYINKLNVVGLHKYVEESGDYNYAFNNWTITPVEGGRCCGDEQPLPDPDPPEPIPGPKIGDCQWFVVVIDAAQDAQGVMRSKYRVYPDDSACGNEYCYWETDAGPRFCPSCSDCPFPYVDIPGTCEPQCLSAVTYVQHVGCTYNEQSNDYDLQFNYEVPEECDLLAIAKRLDAIAQMIDVAGLIPYRVCNEKPKLEGTWVSTRWVSDGDSDNSTRRLRKLIRYRSKSDRSTDQLRDYWSAFTWEAGSAIVQHKGAWWGTPQVWAESADEGKRILRFAGEEAGIDPDTEGQWIVSDTGHARYGMSGKMRLAKPRGQYWATRRDGPSGFDL